MEMAKACSVTGHRELPPSKIEYVRQQLRQEVKRAIAEGYRYFLSGMAPGTDLIFANVVADLRDEKYPNQLYLEAVLPYAKWLVKKDPDFQAAMARKNAVRIICKDYAPSCFFQRNRALVDTSQLLIGVTDGRSSGGTCYTIDYARNMGREVRLIRI